MSKEISVSGRLAAAKGITNVDSGSVNVQLDMTGYDMGKQTQTLSTAWVALAIPAAVGTIKLVMIKHLAIDDTGAAVTGIVDLSYNSGGTPSIQNIAPGAFAIFQPTPSQIAYVRVGSGAAKIEVTTVEA